MSAFEQLKGMPTGMVRLTFQFDNDEVHLVERRPLQGVAPPSDPVTRAEDEQGFCVELRSADDRTVYRRVMSDPFTEHVEVFADPGGSIARAPADRHSGTFFVDVPDIEEGEQVALWSSAAPSARRAMAGSRTGPAVEVARVRLR
jgi:hypothetical protein